MEDIVKHMYNGEVTINFNEEKHIYTIDGIKIPSVSAISGISNKGDVLIGWAVGLVKKRLTTMQGDIVTVDLIEEVTTAYKKEQNSSLSIGTKVHKFAEDYIHGHKPNAMMCPKSINSVNAFLDWVEDNNPIFKHTEIMLYSRKHNFVGLADVIMEIDGKLYLGDWKTSKAVYPNYMIQMAGYAIAYEEEYNVKIEGTMIVRLDKMTGNYEVQTSTNLNADKEAFIACNTIKHRLLNIEKEKAALIDTSLPFPGKT